MHNTNVTSPIEAAIAEEISYISTCRESLKKIISDEAVNEFLSGKKPTWNARKSALKFQIEYADGTITRLQEMKNIYDSPRNSENA